MIPTFIPSPFNPTGQDPDFLKKKVDEQKVGLSDSIQWLERLKCSADFQRYISFVKMGADATRASASNIDQHDPAKRDAYAQRHFGLVDMIEWPEKQLSAAKAALKTLNERPL